MDKKYVADSNWEGKETISLGSGLVILETKKVVKYGEKFRHILSSSCTDPNKILNRKQQKEFFDWYPYFGKDKVDGNVILTIWASYGRRERLYLEYQEDDPFMEKTIQKDILPNLQKAVEKLLNIKGTKKEKDKEDKKFRKAAEDAVGNGVGDDKFVRAWFVFFKKDTGKYDRYQCLGEDENFSDFELEKDNSCVVLKYDKDELYWDEKDSKVDKIAGDLKRKL